MSRKSMLLISALFIVLSEFASTPAQVKTTKLYRQMSPTEQASFVEERVREIARQISGNEYEFTAAFEMEVQKHIDRYARRVGSRDDRPGKSDLHLVLNRGAAAAPTLIAAFKARNVSPMIGLYLPFIESEYINLSEPNSMGAVGMFQFLPATGQRYGLASNDLLSVEKSADAAARYIAGSIEEFAGDPMKEMLALLSYNLGKQMTRADLNLVLDNTNRNCSICALTAARTKLDKNFQDESVHYVPQFLAAAIVGENPQVFELSIQPLSSFAKKQ